MCSVWNRSVVLPKQLNTFATKRHIYYVLWLVQSHTDCSRNYNLKHGLGIASMTFPKDLELTIYLISLLYYSHQPICYVLLTPI